MGEQRGLVPAGRANALAAVHDSGPVHRVLTASHSLAQQQAEPQPAGHKARLSIRGA